MSQNGVSVNLTSMFDDQAQHIAYIIKQVMDRGAPLLAADRRGRDRVGRRNQAPGRGRGALPGRTARPATTTTRATSAKPGRGGFGADAYAPGINAFNALMTKWREKGDLEGLELA